MLQADSQMFLKVVKSRRVHFGLVVLLLAGLLLRVSILLLGLLMDDRREGILDLDGGLLFFREELVDVDTGIATFEVGEGLEVQRVSTLILAFFAAFLVQKDVAVRTLFFHYLNILSACFHLKTVQGDHNQHDC